MSTTAKGAQVHIRCSQCGTFNVNSENCENCGALLSVVKQRELVRQEQFKEVRKREAEKGPSKIELQIKKMQNHRFWLVRAVFEVVYIGWVIAMAVGGFIAWVIAAIVA
ncbi:hypothetical protein [Flavobacterium sp. HSC-61S13]|uniref:hypothetical protein n=1 Tax=Flavobacterium sp. HSC-61S13 TaxID=2910963 RepID=UPI00209ED13D|nr:hypothetical protein [Flavobacterium sp. HSC-61S13]MCP1994832.1 ribosomal protein L37E [Flavobacterium sp. HSC-61S13]